MDDDSLLLPQPFDFTGTVLSEYNRCWFFRDETGGVEIHNLRPETFSATRGSTVRVCGNMTVEKNGVRKFLADTAQIIRPGKVEMPVDATATAILDGNLNYRIVRVRGVLSAVVRDEVDEKGYWATLRMSTGSIYLTLSDECADTIRSAIDAEVVVTGLAAPTTGLRKNLGNRIMVSDLDIVKRSPEDPFSAPCLTDARFPHRQKAHGIVLASELHRFFLKTPVNRVIPICPSSDILPCKPVAGDLVTVVGFTADDPYRTQLSDALVRIDGHTTNQVDRTTSYELKSLFVNENGTKRIETHVDGTFVSIRGHTVRGGFGEIRVTDGPYAVSLDISTLNALEIPIPDDGSEVSVCGLCLAEFENLATPSIYPTFQRFVLVPRNASDLIVIASPPWWTPYRLAMLLIALAVVLLVSTLWNILLKRKSEKRGQELYEEKTRHALAEQKVEERTRLAVELHDTISQTLTGVALQLDAGEVARASAMLASCRGELRRCLWDLRSRTFEEKDMTEAIRRTITPHLNGCAATVRFNVPRERLSESLTHATLRIIRELVVNAIRHGKASHVKVAGEMHGATVSFSVTDNGIGFDPLHIPGLEQGHFGLLGVRERIEDFGGDIKIESTANLGAKITVTLTMTEESNERQNQNLDRR